MNSRSLIITIVGVALSFAGGFLLANAINRSELNSLRGENERLKNTNTSGGSDRELTAEEIDDKFAEADRNAGDFQYQKRLGLALYQYATLKQNTDLLERTIPVLERAVGLNNSDLPTMIGLGNAYFDLAYAAKRNDAFAQARGVYKRALDIKPDADVQTDYALTFFLQEPPDLEAAVRELKRALDIDPKNVKALQFIVQALIKAGKPDEADEFLERLRAADPNESSISQLAAAIQNAKEAKAK